MIDIQKFKTATPVMVSGHKVIRAGYNQMTPIFGKVARRNSFWLWVEDPKSKHADEKGVVLVVVDSNGVPIDKALAREYTMLRFQEGGEGARSEWVKKHFGNYSILARKLGVSSASVSRWVRIDPKQFLLYVEKLSEMTGDDFAYIVNLMK